MKMKKTLTFQNREMTLTVRTYNDKTMALSFTEAETGEPWATLTVCLDFPLPYGVAAIKSYSENEGVLQCLTENNLIHTLVGNERTGYVSIPLAAMNMQALVGLDESGVAEYQRKHKFKAKQKGGFETGFTRISPSLQISVSAAEIGHALARYAECDWGVSDEARRKDNDVAVKTGGAILAFYELESLARRLVIETNACRTETNLFLEKEYGDREDQSV